MRYISKIRNSHTSTNSGGRITDSRIKDLIAEESIENVNVYELEKDKPTNLQALQRLIKTVNSTENFYKPKKESKKKKTISFSFLQ